MIQFTRTILWQQFGASLEMLENAINLCPEEYWDTETMFWYNAYHCLFWTDYYLTLNPMGYKPPHPYTLSEFDPEGALPDRTYSKKELLDYLSFCMDKCYKVLSELTEEVAQMRWINEYKDYSVLEIHLYNMRHVQHHAAQLNLLLRQMIDDAPRWVSVAKREMT